MHAPFEISVGKKRLEEIIKAFPADSKYWNEAENRFQFVDRLLTECLGWERPNMRVEAKDDLGGKADYLLGQPIKAVLEAKKEAILFKSLPTGNPSRVRKIRPLIDTSKAFEKAVNQVLQYCLMQGAQIAIVCNGPQLALFQSMIPGSSPLDGECFFFNGFKSYIEYFDDLWSILSPEGITENRAFQLLALHRNPRIPPKASEFISEPARYRYRNDFQENLRVLSSVLLDEIEENSDLKSSFYSECYVPLEANNRNLLLSKRIIEARYRRAGGDGVAPSALEASAKAGREGELVFNDPKIVGNAGSKPIVIIGDVGVGKSSFFENLYEKLDQSEKAQTYFLRIDLGIKANLSKDVKSFVINAIPSTLSKKYNIDIFDTGFVSSIYHQEIEAFDRSIKGGLKEVDEDEYKKERIKFLGDLVDRQDSHLHASLGHLAKGQNKQIVLIMDNADQRSFSVQQEAFLIAQELAATRNMTVFVALRPSTFYLSKASGALSGYQNKLLTISPPPADKVIEKRLTFALRVAEGKVDPVALSGIRLQLGNVVSFLQATLRSIGSNRDIQAFLSNITGGNTRAVLELVTSFFGSPNVDSQKIVRIEQQTGNYKVPIHEFTKHALLGEYAYFNANSSLVAFNIYDVNIPDPREHFLSSLIISYLSSNVGIRDNDGFISGESILSEMATHGFVEDQSRHALRRLSAKRLIETPHAHYRELPVDEHEPPEQFYFRATSIGIYHVRYWTGNFSFLDATSTDTPIFDQDVRDAISGMAPSFNIGVRYERTETFRRYLEDQWHAANIGANYYNFSALLKQHAKSFVTVKAFLDKYREN